MRGRWTQREEKSKTNMGCGVKEKKAVRSSQRIRQAQESKMTKIMTTFDAKWNGLSS